MTDVFGFLVPASRARLRAVRAPRWTSPMLATLTQRRFSDCAWIFERKFDGQRVLAFVSNGSVRLMSRNQKSVKATYPEVAGALSRQRCRHFIVDGEVVERRFQIKRSDDADVVCADCFDDRHQQRVLPNALTAADKWRVIDLDAGPLDDVSQVVEQMIAGGLIRDDVLDQL